MFSVWARSGYFIAFNEDDQAILYKGREGGVLWIDPTAQNDAGPTRDQLEPERAEMIDDGMTLRLPAGSRRVPPRQRHHDDHHDHDDDHHHDHHHDHGPRRPTCSAERPASDRRPRDDSAPTGVTTTDCAMSVAHGHAGSTPEDHAFTVTSPLARQRRSTELTLLVMAALITGSAYTITALGTNAEIPPGIVFFVGILLGLLMCAHIVVRLVARGADGTLLPLAALLHGIGFVMITRLDDRLAGLQATWSVVAIGAFIATLLLVQRATDLARYSWLLFFIGAGALMLPLVPGLGPNINGARIWVSLGPINFQPGEFAKIALAIFFAAYLADRRELIAASTWKVGPFHLPEPRYIAPIVLAWGFAVVVMVAQKDLGSSLLFFTLFVVMLWVATERVGLPADRPRDVRRRRLLRVDPVRPRADPRRHLARPVGRPARQGATRSSSRSTASPTAA